MEKFKSNTIAVSRDAMEYLEGASTIRSVKAFLLPYTQIYWGKPEWDDYIWKSQSKIYIKIELFADVMGYTISDRITTEIRKVYREMNIELFDDENSPDIYFSYDGVSKDKKCFILKVHKAKEVFNICSHTQFFCMDASDIFRCKNIYDYRILSLVVRRELYRGWDIRKQRFELNTYCLKYRVLGMDLYTNCYVNKKHPKYDKTLLELFDYFLDEVTYGDLSREEMDRRLEVYGHEIGIKNIDGVYKRFKELVTFNKRTRIEEYLQHALEIINQGTMFKISPDEKTGKLFTKTRKNGYRVDKYYISITQKRNV